MTYPSAMQPPLEQGISAAPLIFDVRPPWALGSIRARGSAGVGSASVAWGAPRVGEPNANAASAGENNQQRGSIQPPVLMERVMPAYPEAAKRQNLEGVVVVSAVIGKDGVPRAVRRVSGPADLTQAALDAVAGWRYKPASLGGEPVEVQRIITINFRLRP